MIIDFHSICLMSFYIAEIERKNSLRVPAQMLSERANWMQRVSGLAVQVPPSQQQPLEPAHLKIVKEGWKRDKVTN
jgi:hypothetical protein